jgi:peptide-methionine (S)-S-oxide reductase
MAWLCSSLRVAKNCRSCARDRAPLRHRAGAALPRRQRRCRRGRRAGREDAEVRTAIFAGGCFWCIEADFEKLPGVIAAESGYTAGRTVNPTYEQVSAGSTGHTEAIRVTYDPQKVSYRQLLDYFWRHIDPTVKNRQFCDVGSQYRSGIYWQNEAERKAAEGSRDALLASGKLPRIETEIVATSPFYPAEEYHQDYYKKNPIRYAYYRQGCGRDARVQQIWGGG